LQFLKYNEHAIADIFDWACRLMWSLLLMRSAITGYVKRDGTLEMRIPYILHNYVFGWFAFDFTFVVLQWIELYEEGDFSVSTWSDFKILRIVQVAGMFRLVRLIQVVRVPAYMLPMTQLLFNEWAVLVFGIAKMMMMFLGLVHYAACGYYFVGVSLKHEGLSNWVDYYDLENRPLSVRYVYSLHWSMTNILGEGEVLPQNPWERAYTTLMLCVMFVTSSYVMSTITASLTQINNIRGQHAMQLVRLRQFLASMEISTALTARVLYCAKYVVKERERNLANNRELLSCMSDPLRLQVVHEAYVPTLQLHTFFRLMNDFDMPAMLELADNSVSNIPVTVGDVLFAKGEEPADPAMLYVMRGSCLYIKTDEGVYVPEDNWCLEKVLWLERWRRVGTLRGASNSAVLCVDAKGFRQTALYFENRATVAREYAKRYVQQMQRKFSSGHRFDDLTDDIDIESLAKEVFRTFSESGVLEPTGRRHQSLISNSSITTPTRESGMIGHSAIYKLLSRRATRQSYRRSVKYAQSKS